MIPIHIEIVRWLWGAISCLCLLIGQLPVAVPVTASGRVQSAVRTPLAAQISTRGRVTIREETVTLPTYPYERYQTPAIDPIYNWPYARFDYDRFRTEAPKPEPRDYRAVVLENEYLRIVILPELGGRIWRVTHKPSGNELFYHNPVVMPSPWGPTDMGGWFALGGLEWDLPVAEHGYDWGIPWQVTPLQVDPQTATVVIEAPRAGRKLAASIRVTLRAGAAVFTVEPSIRNVSGQPVRFAFWQTAALAPGHANRPSADLHFVVPGDAVTVHSTGDATLPGPGQRLDWPVYKERDLSRLGNWTDYLGVFERPAAHGPFVAVYDGGQDAGGVRVFPETVARGSKVFGLGYQRPLDPAYYTVDGSSYVELHGGLGPTFDDQVTLAPGGRIAWQESWFPAQGIGDIKVAGEIGALNWQSGCKGLQVSFYPTRVFKGTLVVRSGRQELVRIPLTATPAAPFAAVVYTDTLPDGPLTFQVVALTGTPLLAGN